MSSDKDAVCKDAEIHIERTICTSEDTKAPVVTLVEAAPEDGGLRAWFQVVGGFLLYFNLWGYTFAFGSFQNYYVTKYLLGTSASSIAWIGSIQTFLLILSGLLSGPLFDLGYFKTLMYSGAVLSTFGALMLSFASSYWQIFLSQGVCIGLGCGILFVPSMALIARSFQKRRSLAVSIMSCGAPVGSIIYTFIFEGLLTRIGFAWTARSMAFFMLGMYVIAFPLLLWRTSNTGKLGGATKRKLFDRTALTDGPFWSYALATSTQFTAYLVPYFFMPNYAQTVLGTSTSFGSDILAISQAASIPGRILAAIAAHNVGVMIPWFICALSSGIMCLVWSRVKDVGGFVTFCAIYGFFSGALVPLPPSVFPKVATDPAVLGTRFGMAQAISSVGNFIGPPIAGALLKVHNNGGQNWKAAQLFSAFVLFAAAAQLLGLWTLLVKKRGTALLV